MSCFRPLACGSGRTVSADLRNGVSACRRRRTLNAERPRHVRRLSDLASQFDPFAVGSFRQDVHGAFECFNQVEVECFEDKLASFDF